MGFTKAHAERNRQLKSAADELLKGQEYTDFSVYSDIREDVDDLTPQQRMWRNRDHREKKLAPFIKALKKQFPDVAERKVKYEIVRAVGRLAARSGEQNNDKTTK